MKTSLRSLLTAIAAMAWGAALALPVEPGQWRTITLTDGQLIRAELQGDEHLSYFRSADGRCFLRTEQGCCRLASTEELQQLIAEQQQLAAETATQQHAPRRRVTRTPLTGTKKCLVLLVQFADVKFSEEHTQGLFDRICNERGLAYSETAGGKVYTQAGSVKDYFLDQSNGLFEMDFDVIGPITASHDRDFYGRQHTVGSTTYHDAHLGYLAYEALLQADAEGTDFSIYDWDGDGEVEQFFVVFAGQGQSDGGPETSIWPTRTSLTNQLSHEKAMSKLEGYEQQTFSAPTLDGVLLNTFACAQELKSLKDDDGNVVATCIMGIGCFCHEFSHCLGLHDHYQTSGSANGVVHGPAYWDVMSNGLYNNNTFTPAGYNAYERWFCGWLDPKELTEPQRVDTMRPLSQGGEAYVVYCRGSDIEGEYYLLENRQQVGWDAFVPHHGMLITHVNYNATTWQQNKLNTTLGQEGINLFFAGGVDNRYYGFAAAYPWDPQQLLERYPEHGSTVEEVAQYFSQEQGLAFTTTPNDALTSTSSPATTRYNGATTQSLFTDHDITDIAHNRDEGLTMRFTYRHYTGPDTTITAPRDTLPFLVKTHWGQGSTLTPTTSIWKTATGKDEDYNMYCTFRTIKPSSTTREKYAATYYTTAGSLATALAQLVYYHYTVSGFAPTLLKGLPAGDDENYYDWPFTTGTGKTYTLTTEDAGYQQGDGTGCYDEGATFRFDGMAAGDMTAKAHLIRACGLATRTAYVARGTTSSDIGRAEEALEQVLGFSTTARLVSQNDYTDEAWASLLQGEVEAGRPVLMSSMLPNDTTYVFLIDGYDGDTGRFHVNMGLEGDGDGWYALDGIECPSTVGTGLLTVDQTMVVGIAPEQEETPWLLGDVNGDEVVTVADVTALVNYLLGEAVAGFQERQADANDDGQITIADVTALVNIILGAER